MNSAIVNDLTLVVENICVADPVTPSPYQGSFMVGLQSAVYEAQTNIMTTTYPTGTTVSVNSDGSVTLVIAGGSTETFPAGTTVIEKVDGTVDVTTVTTVQVLVTPATPCDIGWIYDPATGTFSAPQG